MSEENTPVTTPVTTPETAPAEPVEPDLRPTPPPEGVLPQEWRSQQLGPHRKQFA